MNETVMKTKRKLNVGIIGLGVGEQHIAGYHNHPNCKVVALCDFSEEKYKMAKEKYPGMKVVRDADELLNDPYIDVVSIASYDHYHYEQIIRAIENDKHVFVEKPFCLFEHEAVEIRSKLIKKPYLKMSSNLVLRKSLRFMLLKEMIQEGVFGELFYLEGDYNYGRLHKITDGWRGKMDFYSVVYGGGVHIVDLLMWVTGDTIVEVVSYGNRIVTKDTRFRFNDLNVSLLKFKSNAIAKVSANFGCVFPHFHGLCVYGTRATFINGMEYGMFFDSRNNSGLFKKITEPYPGVHKGALIYSFVDSILSNSQSDVMADDIFNSMSVCFAIEKASTISDKVVVQYV